VDLLKCKLLRYQREQFTAHESDDDIVERCTTTRRHNSLHGAHKYIEVKRTNTDETNEFIHKIS